MTLKAFLYQHINLNLLHNFHSLGAVQNLVCMELLDCSTFVFCLFWWSICFPLLLYQLFCLLQFIHKTEQFLCRTHERYGLHRVSNSVELTCQIMDTLLSYNSLLSLETVQFVSSVRLLGPDNNTKVAYLFTVMCYVDHLLQRHSCSVLWSNERLTFAITSDFNFIVQCCTLRVCFHRQYLEILSSNCYKF